MMIYSQVTMDYKFEIHIEDLKVDREGELLSRKSDGLRFIGKFFQTPFEINIVITDSGNLWEKNTQMELGKRD